MEVPPSLQPPSTVSGASASPTRSKSPISQLLESLGMTREDLSRRSAQMREFLTAQNSAASGTYNDFDDVSVTYAKSSYPDTFSSVAKIEADVPVDPENNKKYYKEETPAPNASSQGSAVGSSNDYYSRTRSSQSSMASTTPSSVPSASNASNTTTTASTTQRKKDSTRHTAHKERASHTHRATSHAASPAKSKPSLDEIMQMRAQNLKRSRASRASPESSEESSEEMPPKRVRTPKI